MTATNSVYQTTLSDGTILAMRFEGECDKEKIEAAIQCRN
jgi:hypothetical protein